MDQLQSTSTLTEIVKQIIYAITSQVNKKTLRVDLREALKLESCGFQID